MPHVLPHSRPCPTLLALLHTGKSPWRGEQEAEPPWVGHALTQCRHRSRISWNTLAATCKVGSGRSGSDPLGSAGSSRSSARPPRSSPISWEEVEGHWD